MEEKSSTNIVRFFMFTCQLFGQNDQTTILNFKIIQHQIIAKLP